MVLARHVQQRASSTASIDKNFAFPLQFHALQLAENVFWSYIITILIAVMTSFTLFTVTSNQFLTYRITEDMEKPIYYLYADKYLGHWCLYLCFWHKVSGFVSKCACIFGWKWFQTNNNGIIYRIFTMGNYTAYVLHCILVYENG